MGPRFTVSVHTVLRSTSGAAGFKRETPTVRALRQTRPIAPQIICRRLFCRLNSGLAMSMRLTDMQPPDQIESLPMCLKSLGEIGPVESPEAPGMFGCGVGCSLPDNSGINECATAYGPLLNIRHQYRTPKVFWRWKRLIPDFSLKKS
jgi:hypothetical protein